MTPEMVWVSKAQPVSAGAATALITMPSGVWTLERIIALVNGVGGGRLTVTHRKEGVTASMVSRLPLCPHKYWWEAEPFITLLGGQEIYAYLDAAPSDATALGLTLWLRKVSE